MGSTLDHALSLAKRGFRVFPLIPGGKTPAFAGWKEAATFDEQTIRDWFGGQFFDCNVGVATGRGILAVDADVKGGKRGLESLEMIEMMGADLDFVVTTPSGGRHAYFRVTDGQPVPNSVDRLKDLPGIDIRGDGGFVVAPGTPGYEVFTENPTPEAPSWLLEAARGAKRHRERTDDTGDALIDLDTEQAIQRALMWLKEEAPEAISGNAGNDTTYKVFNWLKDFGLSQDRAVEIASLHWNDKKAFPPWDLADLEAIAANAYAYGTSSPGKRSALAEFDAVEVIDHRIQSDTKQLTFARPIEYGEEQPPHREFAIERLVPKHKTTLLTGDGGMGKSLIAQQMLTCTAANIPFFGMAVQPGPVLAVFSEDDEAELWRRQIDINRSTSLTMSDLGGVNWWSADHVADSGCVLMSFTRENPEGKLAPFFRRLEAAIKQVKPVLVVLDPVANMFGGNEIDRSQVTGFINRTVNRLCVQQRTTAVVLAHPSVAGMAEGSGRSGSTGWANAVRSRLYLTRPKNDATGDYRVLKTTKANYGKFGDEILLKWSQGAFVSAAGSESDPDIKADRSLLAALRIMVARGDLLSDSSRAGNYAVRRAMSLPEVAGLDRSSLEASLERLFRAGAVRMGVVKDAQRRDVRALVVELQDEPSDF